jgi:hypothetical protein
LVDHHPERLLNWQRDAGFTRHPTPDGASNFSFHATTAYDILRHKGCAAWKTRFHGQDEIEGVREQPSAFSHAVIPGPREGAV